jgi:hypothetical protein
MLSGLNNTSFYSAGKSGSASPKIVLSLAQVLGISPYYFTGEIDEKEPLDDEQVNQFLLKIGANEPSKAKKSRSSDGSVESDELIDKSSESVGSEDISGGQVEVSRRRGRPKSDKSMDKTLADKISLADDYVVPEPKAEYSPIDLEMEAEKKSAKSSDKTHLSPNIKEVGFEESVKLLEALYIQSGFNTNAADKLASVKQILLGL